MLFKRGKEKEKEGKKSEIRNVQRLEDGIERGEEASMRDKISFSSRLRQVLRAYLSSISRWWKGWGWCSAARTLQRKKQVFIFN